ncbi:MAG: hypothetical protein Q9227_005319 [Pyrenula ochraceoflavens]
METPPEESKNGSNDAQDRRFTSEIINIKVGEQETIFHVHKDILTANSPFFLGCFRNPWQENTENLFTLPTDDPDAFSRVLCWMYERRLLRCNVEDVSEAAEDREMEVLVKTWILADKLCMEEMKNAAMELIQLWGKTNYVPASVMRKVLHDSPPDSLLRKYIERKFASDFKESMGSAPGSEGYREFVSEGGSHITNIMMLVGDDELTDPAFGDLCEYHEHKETETCCDSN